MSSTRGGFSVLCCNPTRGLCLSAVRNPLDAYSLVIRVSPYISEVWLDPGPLYGLCNNQIADAIDAYRNPTIKQRLALLHEAQRTSPPYHVGHC